MIRDLLNEVAIKFHLWRMCKTTGDAQKFHMKAMYARIAKRSHKQVKRMEKAKVI